MTPVADPINELVKQLKDDEEVRAQTKGLAIMALQEARRIMRIGVPQEKLSLIRGMLPVLARNLSAEKDAEDESLQEMRREMANLMNEIRGA